LLALLDAPTRCERICRLKAHTEAKVVIAGPQLHSLFVFHRLAGCARPKAQSKKLVTEVQYMSIVEPVIRKKIEAMYHVRAELVRQLSVEDTGRATLMFAIYGHPTATLCYVHEFDGKVEIHLAASPGRSRWIHRIGSTTTVHASS
jgi:hypothetical protein